MWTPYMVRHPSRSRGRGSVAGSATARRLPPTHVGGYRPSAVQRRWPRCNDAPTAVPRSASLPRNFPSVSRFDILRGRPLGCRSGPNGRCPDDRGPRPHETLSWPHGRGRPVVLGRSRRGRRVPRAERRGQIDHDAHPRQLHAGDERHGAGGGLRCLPRGGRGAAADRLHAGEQPHPSRHAGAGVLEVPRAAERPRLASQPGTGGHRAPAMRPEGCPETHHRPALERLPPARRAR